MVEVINTELSDLKKSSNYLMTQLRIRKRMAIPFGEITIKMQSLRTLRIKTNTRLWLTQRRLSYLVCAIPTK